MNTILLVGFLGVSTVCYRARAAIAAILLAALMFPLLSVSETLEWRFTCRNTTMAVAALFLIGRRRARSIGNLGTALLSLVVAWFFFTSAFAADWPEAAIRAASFLVILLLALELSSARGFSAVVTALYYLGMFILVASGLAIFVSPSTAWHGTGRLQGVLGNPNDIGTLCWVMIAIESCIDRPVWGRNMGRAALIICYVTLLVLTASRSSIAAGAAAMLWRFHSHKRILPVGVAIICIATALWLAATRVGSVARYLRISEEFDLAGQTSGRDLAHTQALMSIAEHPWLGIGMGNLETGGSEKGRRAVAQLGFHLVAVETGIIGLMLLTVAVCWPAFQPLARASISPVSYLLKVPAQMFIVGYLVNSTGENYLGSAMIYPTLLAWTSASYLYRSSMATRYPSRGRWSEASLRGIIARTR